MRSHPTKGTLYLYIKTIERAHTPNRLWEKIKLSQNYQKALQQLDERLVYFPKFQTHKCKQRLTRLTQVAIRMRRIAAEEARLGEKLVPKMAPKIRHREAARERKAESAAKLEKTIERELIERLRQGAYGDQPLNVSEAIWKKVLNGLEREGGGTRDKDMDRGIEDDDEEREEEDEEDAEEEYEDEAEDDELDGQVEYVSDVDESDEELADIEDWLGSEEDKDDDDEDDSDDDSEEEEAQKKKGKAGAGDKRKRGRVVRMKPKKRREVETEHEHEGERQKLMAF